MVLKSNLATALPESIYVEGPLGLQKQLKYTLQKSQNSQST